MQKSNIEYKTIVKEDGEEKVVYHGANLKDANLYMERAKNKAQREGRSIAVNVRKEDRKTDKEMK